jgi:hypothetical protein
MVSRSLDIDYLSLTCKYAFNITSLPDTDKWINNRYGGFEIDYPRLAFVGGQADPWKEATPLADTAPARQDTVDRPFVEIEGGVHHCEFRPTYIL